MIVKTFGPAIVVLPAMASALGGLGFMGPMPPAPTVSLHAREEGTPINPSPAVITPEPTSSLEYSAKFGAEHLNLLKARGFCAKKCDWQAFCVEDGGYGGCCDVKYSSCFVATTCIDYATHLNAIQTWNATKTIMCPLEQPYCTMTMDNDFDFLFVDCGTDPVSKQTTSRSTTGDPTTTTEDGTFLPSTSTIPPTATNDDTDDGTVISKSSSKKKLSAGAGAGIGVGAVVLIAAIVGLVMFLRKRRKDTHNPGDPSPDMAQQPGNYPPSSMPPSKTPNNPPPGVQEVYAPMKVQGSDSGYNNYNNYGASTTPSPGPFVTAPYYQQMQPGPNVAYEVPADQNYPGQAYGAPPPGEILVEAPGSDVRH